MRVRQAIYLGISLAHAFGCGRKEPGGSNTGAAASTSAASPPASATGAPSTAAATPTRIGTEPDTLSQASPVHALGAPVPAAGLGEVDGAKLRARHVARLKSDRSPVTVLSGASALELGQRLCEAVVPARPPEAPVLVKPNLCGFDGFKNTAKVWLETTA